LIKILICLSIPLFICNASLSMEDNDQLDLLYHPKCEVSFSRNSSSFDEERYAQVSGYNYIQPDFRNSVLSGPSEVLEICAGQGQVLGNILERRNASPDSTPLTYTVVENSKTNMEKIKEVFRKSKRNGDRLYFAQKDLVEFLETNLEGKRNKYDHVFGGFALHIFAPKSFVAIVNGLFDVLKEGGQLYLTQHSFSGERYNDEYIQKVKQGQLLPFWSKDGFSSDPVTMEKLLNAFGFQVIKSGLYQEIYGNETTTKYLGIIAQKNTALYNAEKVRQYNDAADMFFQELDCSNDVSRNKARLSLGAKESSLIWSIHDPKVGEGYDALTVCTTTNGNNLFIEKFEIHKTNKWTIRAIHTFLFQAVHHKDGYETIFVRGSKDDITSKILTSRFSFVEDNTYQDSQNPQELIQLKASVPDIKNELIL
jgi:SAM-dependent methyltransferase